MIVWMRRSCQRAHAYIDGRSCPFADAGTAEVKPVALLIPPEGIGPHGRPYGRVCIVCDKAVRIIEAVTRFNH